MSRRLGLGLLLLGIFAIYAPSLGNTFAMDDRVVVKAVRDGGVPNPMVAELQPLGEYFTTPYWVDGEVGNDPLYRPLTVLSYALTYKFLSRPLIGGGGSGELEEALPHHAINILLHLLAVWLVYQLLLSMTRRPWAALLGAAAFGAHSIHSEVVAAIVGRAELLSMCFGASATLLFAKALASSGLATWARFSGVAVLLAAACFSKESGIAWVAFVPVFAIAKNGGMGIKRSLMGASLVAAVPVTVFLLARSAVQPDEIFIDYMANPLWYESGVTRILTAFKTWGYGLLLTVLPLQQSIDYGAHEFTIVPSLDLASSLAVILLLGVLVGGFFALKRHPLLFLAATAFLGFSVLTSNVLFPIGTMFAERLYYVPSLAISFVLAWLALEFRRSEVQRVAVVAGAALWLGFNAKTVLERNHIWKNDEVLFRHAVLEAPRVVRLHLNRAQKHEALGELTAALNHYDIARSIEPRVGLPWNNTAAILFQLGRLDEAERAAKQGLATPLHHPLATGYKLWANLGLIHAALGRNKEALDDFAKCLSIRPDFAKARHDMLHVVLDNETPEVYERILAEGEKLAPQHPLWRLHRGYLAHKREQWAEAERHLRPALLESTAFRPEYGARLYFAQMVLADALLKSGGRDEAAHMYEGIAADARAPGNIREAAQGLLNRLRANAAR